MRLKLGTFALLIIAFSAGSANALLLGIDGHDPSQPFLLTIPQNGNVLLDRVLQITNTSTTVSVMAWQLDLWLHPLSGAQGSVLFQSTGTPDDSLFGPDPGPQSDLNAPSNQFIASDADTSEEFDGVPVSQNEHRNLLQTTISATPTASGTFELIMPEFNPEAPEQGSSWIDAETFETQGFENSWPSSVPGYILIGTIQINPTASVGDYNNDQVIDNLDYATWRAAFGESAVPPGQGADGNQNGIVDVADYVVWRNSVTAGSGALLVEASNVPEPVGLSTWMTAMIGILFTSRFRSRRATYPNSVATLRT